MAHVCGCSACNVQPWVPPVPGCVYTAPVTLLAANHCCCRTSGYTDPAAAAFIARFARLGRDTHLAYLNTSATQALHDNLQLITPTQWDGLKGYVGQLMTGFGAEAFAGLVATQSPVIDYTRGAIQVRVAGMFWHRHALNGGILSTGAIRMRHV